MTHDIRARDMDDVGIELFEIAANRIWEGDRQPVFGTARDCGRGHAYQIAGGREGRLRDCWRIDPDLHALPHLEYLTHTAEGRGVLEPHARLRAWIAHMTSRAAVARAIPQAA